MKKLQQQMILVFFLSICIPVNAQQKVKTAIDELATIRKTCRELLLSATPYATEQSYLLTDDVIYTHDGAGYFKSLTAFGGWDDINYKSKVNSTWPPSWHLYRLMLVTRAYYNNHDPTYLAAIHKALKFWMDHDFKSENWWQNQINTPYVFSSILLMLAEDANKAELDFLNNILAKRVIQDKATGQNKIWQHDAEARIALLNNDAEAFKNAMAQMQTVIKISTEEGIQPDFSFQQHGAMLQFGNYGIHFVNSLLFWIKVSSNSTYAFDQSLQKIIVAYCTEGLRYTIFKKGMDMTAIGRQLKINSATRRGQVLSDNFNLIKSLNIGNEANYTLDGFGTESPKLALNKSFWRSAYMLQSDEGKSLISVKLQGIFVRPIETINAENLRGSLLNDGVTLIQRTGKEYRNIEPLWNWTMLPGTTADTTINPADESVFKAKNKAQFIGQVSNGKVGITSMDYDRLAVKANKSYFFANGMMVALGAGIDRKDVVTTVDQTFKNNKPLLRGKNNAGQQWLWHDEIAYVFFGPRQIVNTKIEHKTGRWSTIDKASSNEPISDTLLTTYLSHQKNNGYSYLVKPNISLSDTKKITNALPVKFFRNTVALQALQIDTTYFVVFYNPGSIKFSSKLKIATDQPCLLIYDGATIWVSDPTRTQKRLTIAINGKQIICELPQNELLGSTIALNVF